MYPDRPTSSRRLKALAVLVFDALALPVALYLALALRLGEFWPEGWIRDGVALWLFMQGAALVLSFTFGVPSIKVSTLDRRGQVRLASYALAVAALGTIANLEVLAGVPRTVPVIFGVFYFFALIAGRLAASAYINARLGPHGPLIRVAIYGAGSAGIQLEAALRQSREIEVVALVDDNPHLKGVIIGGIRVGQPDDLRDLARQGLVDRVLICMPSVPRAQLGRIAARLETLPCQVQILPGYVDLLSNGRLVDSLRPVASADLLGRTEVSLDIPEVPAAFADTVAMVTGAGGTIGAELCRQLLDCAPRRLVLYENNEFALFKIERELRPVAEDRGIDLVAVLGSICDSARVRSAIETQGVRTILHAAAYKHVPIVEENVLEGVKNNVFGTKTLADAARDCGIDRFILVSTDKAVRPANVMGGTKRMAEIIVQDLQKRAPDTKFAMVRFGNVLESSGSVVPIFRQQIGAGGPVTVTHPEMTRYFMTVPEAARLVLLAASFAEGGEVFVLDMGQPVKIADMARRMIELSGLSVRDADHPAGDVEIVFTGARPGEKLYEELLIGDGMLQTPHPKIQRAEEDCPTQIEVATALQDLHTAVGADAPETARTVLANYAMVRREEIAPIPFHAAE